MRSKRRSDPGELPPIEIPTTAADVAALRAARERMPGRIDWQSLAQLDAWFPESRRRATFEGWEPFVL